MKQDSRKQIYVQKSIQGRLAARCIIYWCSCLLSVVLFLFMGKILSQQSVSPGQLFAEIFANHGAVMVASLLLVPLVVWDMIKFSHRVVGPLIRLEREMQKLADGQSVRPLHFRENDFWHGLATQFNALRMRHLQLDHHAQIVVDDKPTVKKEEIAESERVTQYPV